MKKLITWDEWKEAYDSQSINSFGYDMLKEVLLNDILGKEEDFILYLAGRHLARKFPCTSIEELEEMCHWFGFGSLIIEKEKKNGMWLKLTSTEIEKRLQVFTKPSFQLEAGFIAEQIQHFKRCITEATEEKRKKDAVFFFVQWDPSDSIEDA
ncbi:DUF2507 domain-containing protein [Massilibacterium senegalense]|uniref:DUF2507 domain-containing protein n=1 Tax=Massilibacterium senegalense TaxID=1632858 RepID=UPI000782B8ED|nr:DUF2507 domain-containing protein [Massilibacterium senegalense]